MDKKRKDKIVKMLFWVFVTGIFVYVITLNLFKRQEVLKNPVEVVATITGIENCFKGGRCVKFTYDYKSKRYESWSSTDLSFPGWCKKRNGCKGLRFEIIISKDDPEKVIANWDRIFKGKDFLNLP